MGIINEGDLQRLVYRREDITVILGSFLGNLNILLGFCGIIFVNINRNNIKLILCRCIFK